MGKGSTRRPTDEDAFRDNFDRIFRKEEPEAPPPAETPMEDLYVLDCTGRRCRVGDTFTYATRRSSTLWVNQYRLDCIQDDCVKATIIGGPSYSWRSCQWDDKKGIFVDKTPRQSTLSAFSDYATLIGDPK
jgi:hypothetical protein